MPQRRYKGYTIYQYRGAKGSWHAWLVTPDGRHVFVKGKDFDEAERLSTEFVDTELLNRLREDCHQ
jgi:hypothetical protein